MQEWAQQVSELAPKELSAESMLSELVLWLQPLRSAQQVKGSDPLFKKGVRRDTAVSRWFLTMVQVPSNLHC